MVKVQKNIPLAHNAHQVGSGQREGWNDIFSSMEAGDSFFYPEEDKKKVNSALYAYRKSHPSAVFSIAAEADGGTQGSGYRLWRLRDAGS